MTISQPEPRELPAVPISNQYYFLPNAFRACGALMLPAGPSPSVMQYMGVALTTILETNFVFADPGASTILARVVFAVVFADQSACAKLALGALAVVFADPGASAAFALGALALVFADP